jgi:hypothetical protein
MISPPRLVALVMVASVALFALLLWVALATQSVVAWMSLAILLLMPPLMVMVSAHAPARTIAEVLREAETTARP